MPAEALSWLFLFVFFVFAATCCLRTWLFAASALATPHILRRIDVQARVPVVVEREADQLLAAANAA